MRRSSVILFVLSALAGGCGNDPATGVTDGSVDIAVVDEKPMTRPDFWMPSGCISGSLVVETGDADPMTSILACTMSICNYGMSGADGHFKVCNLHLTNIAVKTEEDLTATPRHAAAMCPAKLTMNDQMLDIGMLTVPLLGAGANIAGAMDMPQTVMAGDGLSLTVTQKDLSLPLGYSVSPPNVAARLVAADKHCPLTIPDGGALLATYALSPFTTTSKSKIGVSATVKAPANSEVHFWWISELDGSIKGPAIGHADGSGMSVATDPGAGIDELSWLLVSAKP